MEASTSFQSYFQDLKSRELNGFKVRKRVCIEPDCTQIGAMAVEHDGISAPPLATSFCKTDKLGHMLAMSDEDGYVSLYDTRRKLSSFSTYIENAEKAKVTEWIAHDNAIFDVCWIKEDTHILTASADQTIRIWNVEVQKRIGILMRHTATVKSLASHLTNTDIVVSGSRDGSFALWDLRCTRSNKSAPGELFISPTATVKGAHLSPQVKRVTKTTSMSITSVLFLKDEVSIATAGAVDSVVKFWDSRRLRTPVTQTCPQLQATQNDQRLHGISSLSQDRSGVFFAASCMDNRIYLYNVLQLEKGPVKSFSGCKIDSFFVKSVISPDAEQILSGSTDGNAYVWQVNKPQMDPIKLKGHEGEVTAVDWCSSLAGKVATCSDDYTIRLWNVENSCISNSRPPTSLRRRVTAVPSDEREQLLMDGTKVPNKVCPSEKTLRSENPFNTIQKPNIRTPESQKKKTPIMNLYETVERTPDLASDSPSSVLNPPSSLKRKTIRDYFPTSSMIR